MLLTRRSSVCRVSLLPHPLRCPPLSPLLLTPATLCMLAGSDLAWGAIVLSLIKQWRNAFRCRWRGRCRWLWRASSCWLFESTCWKEWVTWERAWQAFFFFPPPHVLCVGAMLTQASRWRCYSLLHSHSVALWPHGRVLSLVLGEF